MQHAGRLAVPSEQEGIRVAKKRNLQQAKNSSRQQPATRHAPAGLI